MAYATTAPNLTFHFKQPSSLPPTDHRRSTLRRTVTATSSSSLHPFNNKNKPQFPPPSASPAVFDTSTTAPFTSRFTEDEPRKGANILLEALEREGIRHVFAYPGGASLEIHQALTRSKLIKNTLPRHEQGGVFAAEGYARSSGKVGVCIATSGPGATNLVSGIADAQLDSVPLVAITDQVPRRMIGTDAFQETPIVEVTKSITKHNYLVTDVEEIPRIVREAFYIASPKKPILYVGGGSLNSSEELRRFVDLTGIPVASTIMGLGSFPCDHELSLQMLGMHGAMYANYAIDGADLFLAFGVRFDDRVTGKVESFASRATIVHIDIDSAEIRNRLFPDSNRCLVGRRWHLGLGFRRVGEQADSRRIVEAVGSLPIAAPGGFRPSSPSPPTCLVFASQAALQVDFVVIFFFVLCFSSAERSKICLVAERTHDEAGEDGADERGGGGRDVGREGVRARSEWIKGRRGGIEKVETKLEKRESHARWKLVFVGWR